MPLLNPEHVANLHYFSYLPSGVLISEEFSEIRRQTNTEPVKLTQGDIGYHVINRGGIKWESEFSGPTCIFANSDFMSVSDLLISGYQDDLFRLSPSNEITCSVLKSGTINIDANGVQCKVLAWSNNSISSWLKRSHALPAEVVDNQFIGRVAKFYDCVIELPNWIDAYPNVDFTALPIINGSIVIDIDVQDHYFIRTGVPIIEPYADFFVQGYNVHGSITVAYHNGEDMSAAILSALEQTSHGNMFVLNIAGTEFDLSKGKLVSLYCKQMIKKGELCTIEVEFQSSATK